VGKLIRLLAVVGCLLFANYASALDYIWFDGAGNNSADPREACDMHAQMVYGDSPTYTLDHTALGTIGESSAQCMVFLADKVSGEVIQSGQFPIRLAGSTCPSGTGPYDPTTGRCLTTPQLQPGDKCTDQSGGTSADPMIWNGTSCTKFSDSSGDAPCAYIAKSNPGTAGQSYQVAGNISSTGQAIAPPEFAGGALKCAIGTISTSQCTINTTGAVSCNVVGKILDHANPTGQVDAADALCPNGTCPPKDPVTATKNEGCVPIGNGTGGTTCTETKETTAEGAQQCGLVNGGYTCITKKPASNGIGTTITATSETLADGSVKVTTVKDSTATICTDVKTCTTTHSTTTQHSTSSPSGTTKTDTSCTGTCNTSGGGVETNPGAGTGVGGGGNGTCTGSNCGDGGDGTASTTDDCASPPPCDGDPFLCAILKQQHIDTCKLMAVPDATLTAQWDAKIAASNASLDVHQTAMDTQVNTLLGQFQSATSGSGGGGGQCLPDIPISVRGYTVTMEFAKACETISFVRLIMLAIAYLAAARIVFKEV
jgi:hypothetical protein